MAAQDLMISADSHVIEPRNLWVERMEKAFRDRAPRVETNPGGLSGEWFICEGLEPRPASLAFAAGKDPSEYNEFQKAANYDDGIAGGWEAAPRLKDMALDGVEAEIIYTTLGFRLFGCSTNLSNGNCSGCITTGWPSCAGMRPNNSSVWR